MAIMKPVASQHNHSSLIPTFTCCSKLSSKIRIIPHKNHQPHINRRTCTATLVSVLLARESVFSTDAAYSFDFRVTVPDQTIEEAESVVRAHAQDLLQVKELIDLESWGAAQSSLRKSSSKLKQDIYTIIQSKPGSERPQLRKLYSNLFNNVTRLNYAARSKDMTCVQECYNNILAALDDILSRL